MSDADRLPVTIRLYPSRRLYDAAAGQYRSLDELLLWKERRLPFAIIDHETAEDLTSLVLSGR
jgi:polyhydroxyalkanoate synthesis regulator protein